MTRSVIKLHVSRDPDCNATKVFLYEQAWTVRNRLQVQSADKDLYKPRRSTRVA